MWVEYSDQEPEFLSHDADGFDEVGVVGHKNGSFVLAAVPIKFVNTLTN